MRVPTREEVERWRALAREHVRVVLARALTEEEYRAAIDPTRQPWFDRLSSEINAALGQAIEDLHRLALALPRRRVSAEALDRLRMQAIERIVDAMPTTKADVPAEYVTLMSAITSELIWNLLSREAERIRRGDP